MNKDVKQFLDYVKINPISELNDYSTDVIQEFIEYLQKNGDVKTADGKSALAVLIQELEKRKEEAK